MSSEKLPVWYINEDLELVERVEPVRGVPPLMVVFKAFERLAELEKRVAELERALITETALEGLEDD